MDPCIEVLAVAIQDHRRSLDSRIPSRQHRASDIGNTSNMSGSLASSLSTSLFGLSPRPSGGFMRAASLERTSSNAFQTSSDGAGSLARQSYTGEDFESLVSGYALRIPAVSAPVPVPTKGGRNSSILTHALSMPIHSGGYASAMASPVVGRTQAKATGDIGLYWDNMNQA